MKLTHVLLVIAVLVMVSFQATTAQAEVDGGDYCRVLAASGGGDRIAFELGAVYAFDALFNSRADLRYDVVTGISAGSLLASMFSRYPIGQESMAINEAKKAVFSVKSRDSIIQDWPSGIWDGLFNHSGLYDSSPLLNKINEWVLSKPATDRHLIIGAVALEDAKMDIYNERSENLNLGILGSCSVPGVFPNVPVKFSNGTTRHYNDGAVKQGILIEPGIQACLDRGYPADKIVIDILLCYSVDFKPGTIGDLKTIESTLRALQAGGFQTSVAKLSSAYNKFPQVNFRYIIQPDPNLAPLPSVGLNFDPIEMQYMYERGMNDTKAQFDKYPNGNAKAMMSLLNDMVKDNVVP